MKIKFINSLKLCLLTSALLMPTLLFGCHYNNDDSIAYNQMVHIFDIIQLRDSNKIEELFSKNVNLNCELTDDIADLLNYYQGNYIDIKMSSGLSVSESNEYGKNKEVFDMPFVITTDKEKYSVAVSWCRKDDNNSDNIGLTSLYILKSANNPFPDFTYWGDGVKREGIIIDMPYAMTYIKSITDSLKENNQIEFESLLSNKLVESEYYSSTEYDSLLSIFDGQYTAENCFIWPLSNNDAEGYKVSAYLIDESGTNMDIYAICVQIILEADDDSLLGVNSIYFKDVEDTINMEEAYIGDGSWSLGIHIE